ncbi:hypothetical protein AYO40_02995 [Planctomycetaceae bacterium SCGC AG-212-D15]|nr:hypothetical protein AYO40_02995 [Planctomycetaceae bacterium SCGC AG-212-D15]
MAAGPFNSILRRLRALGAGRLEGGPSDGELLEQFIHRGEETAFEALLTRHGPMVWGVCRRRLPQLDDAEDAFQATFLLLVRKARSIRKRESVASWLYGVAGRVAQRARKRALEWGARARSVEDVPQPTPEGMAWQALQPILDEEVQRLPEKYRAPLVLCCLEGLSRDEAARRLGWKLGSVKGRLERGRELLRVRLTRRGLSMSSALLAATLTAETARAVPAAMHRATIAAAVGGTISPSVATLTQGVIQAMFWTRLKRAIVLVLFVSVGAGSGVLTYRALAREAETPPETVTSMETASAEGNAANAGRAVAGAPIAAGAPVPEAKLKTDAEVLKFLIQRIREDNSIPGCDWSKIEERFQQGQRQPVAAFTKAFKKHELWLVSDGSPIGGGRNPRWILAVDRTRPEAFLIADVFGNPFKKNVAALFAAEGLTPKDKTEALALAKLVVSLTCHSSGSVVFRDELSPEQIKTLDAGLTGKLDKPSVAGESPIKVKLPAYQVALGLFTKRGSVVVYDFEFGAKGEVRFEAAVLDAGKESR